MNRDSELSPNVDGPEDAGTPLAGAGSLAPFSLTQGGGGTELQLAPTLDLGVAEPLRQALLEALDLARPILIDGRPPQIVSTACVQVLLCAAAAAQKNSVPLTILSASPALRSGIEDLGLMAELGSRISCHD